jgi:hypothetical protein
MARPPRLPDTAILELITELRDQHAVLTGTRVRSELRRRYGTPCGVARIYRLLQAATAPVAVPSPSASTTSPNGSDVHTELTAALERARLAEHREEVHQARWAGEIHQLREQVHALRDASHRLRVLESEVLNRSHQLAAAYRRIADLEEQLIRRP